MCGKWLEWICWCFVQDKSYQTNVISLFDRITGLIALGSVWDVIYLDFGKASGTVPEDVLISKLRKCNLDSQYIELSVKVRELSGQVFWVSVQGPGLFSIFISSFRNLLCYTMSWWHPTAWGSKHLGRVEPESLINWRNHPSQQDEFQQRSMQWPAMGILRRMYKQNVIQ